MVIRCRPLWMRLRRRLDSSSAALIHPDLYGCRVDHHKQEDENAFDV